jgi:hypothetical protein
MKIDTFRKAYVDKKTEEKYDVDRKVQEWDKKVEEGGHDPMHPYNLNQLNISINN